MDGENDGAAMQAQGAGQQAAQGDQAAQQQAPQQQAPVTAGAEDTAAAGGDDKDALTRARVDYERALAERDAKIAALEGEIAQASKTAEAAEKLRAEMDELRAAGEAQRVEFELRLAGAKNVKAATALLADHGGDVSKLKEAEPWLFEGATATTGGTTGLEPAGAAGSGEEAELKRWREIAGLDEK